MYEYESECTPVFPTLINVLFIYWVVKIGFADGDGDSEVELRTFQIFNLTLENIVSYTDGSEIRIPDYKIFHPLSH